MARLRSLYLACAGLIATTTAVDFSVKPSNASSGSGGTVIVIPGQGSLDVVDLQSEEIPMAGYSGTVFLTNTTSFLDVQAGNIAAISCDKVPGDIQADDIFAAAVQKDPAAILFYSTTSDWCESDTAQHAEVPYRRIFSMNGAENSNILLGLIDDMLGSGMEFSAEINWQWNIDNRGQEDGASGLYESRNDDDNDDDNDSGPAPTTAVAMIILYSITGIITALFLVIITTGAVRAHRHPERYGPRNIIGRPRQSRAKGIARAMLDTLPVVKFGQREQEEPKTTDVELAENGVAERTASDTADTTTTATNQASPDTSTAQNTNDSPPSADRRASIQTESGIAAAAPLQRTPSTSGGVDKPISLGCSICTEDFQPGQDQRVLPCDHRFHPECVDPWLLNVSGTCPLCRIDLHPAEGAEGEGEVDAEGNPVPRALDADGNPIVGSGAAAAGTDVPRMSVRRSILIGLIGSRSVDRMTQEERLAVLRQMRARRDRLREATAAARSGTTQADGQGAAQAEQEDAAAAGRRGGRLRGLFGGRTSRTATTTNAQGEAGGQGEPTGEPTSGS